MPGEELLLPYPALTLPCNAPLVAGKVSGGPRPGDEGAGPAPGRVP